MFDFFQAIFAKVTAFVVGIVAATGLVSPPTAQPQATTTIPTVQEESATSTELVSEIERLKKEANEAKVEAESERLKAERAKADAATARAEAEKQRLKADKSSTKAPQTDSTIKSPTPVSNPNDEINNSVKKAITISDCQKVVEEHNPFVKDFLASFSDLKNAIDLYADFIEGADALYDRNTYKGNLAFFNYIYETTDELESEYKTFLDTAVSAVNSITSPSYGQYKQLSNLNQLRDQIKQAANDLHTSWTRLEDYAYQVSRNISTTNRSSQWLVLFSSAEDSYYGVMQDIYQTMQDDVLEYGSEIGCNFGRSPDGTIYVIGLK